MFYYLKGELALRDINFCVIDCGGVGYKLTVSMLTSESLSAMLNKEVKLYTHLAVREDGVELFGFGSAEEKNAFTLLTSVSGVGPKAAMSILSVLTADKLALAICTDDKKSISKASGIGPKMAARIILELKDKLSKEMGASSLPFTDSSAGSITASHAQSPAILEATEALMVLGYDKATINAVLGKIDVSGKPSAEIIRAVLKNIAR